MDINFILRLKLLSEVFVEVGGGEEVREIFRLLEGDLVAFRYHTEECINSLRYLIFGTRNADHIAGLLSAREVDLAVPLLLEFFDLWQAGDEFTMIESIDENGLGDKFCILYDVSSTLCKEWSALTTFSTMSMISCLTRSRL